MNTDEKLVKMAKSGDMKAFTRLVSKYDRHVMNIAYSFRNCEEDANDIYQEVFLRVFRGLKNFEFRSEFSTWIYRITSNVCISWERKKGTNRFESIDKPAYNGEDETSFSEMLPGDSKADEATIRAETAEMIDMAIDSLPPQQKMAFVLKYYRELKIREIAVIMNCGEGTVKRYLFNSTRKVRELLKSFITN